MNERENDDCAYLFTLDKNGITRNDGYKIVGKRFTFNKTRNFFTYRVIENGSNFPEEET